MPRHKDKVLSPYSSSHSQRYPKHDRYTPAKEAQEKALACKHQQVCLEDHTFILWKEPVPGQAPLTGITKFSASHWYC